MIKILAASVGILAVSWLPHLPTLPQSAWQLATLLLPIAAVICLLLLHPRTRPLAWFCLGALWGISAGHRLLAGQLPAALEGEELLVSGYISALPEDRDDFQRFEFSIDDFHNIDPVYLAEQPLPKRVLLSWYGQDSQIRVAQRWTLRIRLKRPRGFVNTGGFDYQRWLLSRGLGATGYVRPSTHNQLHGVAPGYTVQKQRQRIRDWIAGAVDSDSQGLLLALAIGDSSAISPEQWELLRATGTSHLMAISGLHIGLIALFGYWLGHALRAACSLLGRRLGLGYLLPGCVSCILAACYSAMAGFSLPTQRALIMVLLVNIAIVLSRVGTSMRALAWAMLIVLLLDPLSAYQLGFWLSFGAVGFLLFHFQHRYRTDSGAQRFVGFGRAQWVVFVGLMVPLLALNQALSLLTPLANLIAIPLVSLVAVMPLLLGVLLSGLDWSIADALLQLAAATLRLCLWILDGFTHHLKSVGWYPQGAGVSLFSALLALAGVLLLLSPRGIPGRWLGVVLLFPLLLPGADRRPPLAVTVLDVGQGLAIVVATPSRLLVYDTGPAYSERFNAGDAIVGPYLRARGIHKIDRLIVSHGDADHAGGTEALMAGVAVDDLIVGNDLPRVSGTYPDVPASRCDSDAGWRWDEVSFRLIEPDGATQGRNNQSCILLIEYAGQRVLIPGDIEAPVERILLAAGQLPRSVAVLVAPHHGSATSSTPGFVEQTQAQRVVYSAGYRSNY
ncbi:MAG: DNA internalization-related competence protein ComEC/Rec2, partial [Cellvibrionaceae bacterium]